MVIEVVGGVAGPVRRGGPRGLGGGDTALYCVLNCVLESLSK